MRIAIINQFYTPGLAPTAHMAASLADHRAALGDEVVVVTSHGGYVTKADTVAGNTPASNPRIERVWTPQFGKQNLLRRISDYASFLLGALWRLATLPAQDVVVAMTTPPYVVMLALVHRALHPRARVILWNQDSFPEGIEASGAILPGSWASRTLGQLNRFIYRRVASVVCLDEAMLELSRKWAPPTGGAVLRVVPNWEPAAMFPVNLAAPDWPQAIDLNLDGRFVVLYLGNAGYAHDFDTILAAARQLIEEPFVFLFVGGGKRWNELERARRDEGLANIVLHPYVSKDETPAVMKAGHCALITLRDESRGVCSPSKMHANLAMRLPIVYVGPEKTNVDEAIRTFNCGASLRNGDVDGLVAFLRRLASDRRALTAYADRARAAFDEAYCDSHTLAQFDAVIRSALSSST